MLYTGDQTRHTTRGGNQVSNKDECGAVRDSVINSYLDLANATRVTRLAQPIGLLRLIELRGRALELHRWRRLVM